MLFSCFCLDFINFSAAFSVLRSKTSDARFQLPGVEASPRKWILSKKKSDKIEKKQENDAKIRKKILKSSFYKDLSVLYHKEDMLPIYTNMLPIYSFVINMLPIYCSANICYANTFLLDVRLNFWKESVCFVWIYSCFDVINRGKVRKKREKFHLLSIMFMFQLYSHFSSHS